MIIRSLKKEEKRTTRFPGPDAKAGTKSDTFDRTIDEIYLLRSVGASVGAGYSHRAEAVGE